MWFVLGAIAISILLEPKKESGLLPMLVEAVAFPSFFLPIFCLSSAKLSVLGERVWLLPVVGILLVLLLDFATSWMDVMDQLVITIRKKGKRERK